MSSILDRLREVEGTTFPKEAGSGTGEPFVVRKDPPFTTKSTKHTKPQMGRKRNSASNGRLPARSGGITVLCRLFAGVLVLLVVLMVWRPWSSQPLARREGGGLSRERGQAPLVKPLSQASNPQIAPPTGAHGVVLPRPDSQPPNSDSGGSSFLSGSPGGNPALLPGEAATSVPGRTGEAPDSDSGSDSKAEASAESVAESPPAGAAAVADDAPTKAFLRTLTITGIYQDASGYIAFINGRAMQEGDKIEQVEIAEITSGRITFAHKGKRYVLPLR
ncbi:MAG: hypothetical protein Q8Q12_15360 [bacterium]|nr:hypothetical protein [bacterium]